MEIISNPGNKRCRICRALITGPQIIRSGCNWKHLTCSFIKHKKTSKIKQIKSKPRRLKMNNERGNNQ